MSIVWTLRKYIDPIQQREEEAAHERDRKVARRQGSGEGEGDPPAAPATHECRVCGYRSTGLRSVPERRRREEPQSQYCPNCLADTMVEVETETK